ncbi:hypothetical protein [Nitrosopumilus ureiphilus]|uniref:C2H2-type domain-containing protein n=1 Tax=Nitrosopumilus ureiphilus TaxID=1470067 RepID=A0A7D5M9T7_9ARCH|nr:hypothetical protein [Nitrosopumilus ureiphilus]QLH06589.1 hypothetical protein C5F50_05530 [Nitrosopumilus ureiphilus]
MTIDNAVKDIQDIYDLVVKFNEDIQDVPMSKIPELGIALKNVFDDNDINKLKPLAKSFVQAIKGFTFGALLVKEGDNRLCVDCGKAFAFHKECDYHTAFGKDAPVDCLKFIEPTKI